MPEVRGTFLLWLRRTLCPACNCAHSVLAFACVSIHHHTHSNEPIFVRKSYWILERRQFGFGLRTFNWWYYHVNSFSMSNNYRIVGACRNSASSDIDSDLLLLSQNEEANLSLSQMISRFFDATLLINKINISNTQPLNTGKLHYLHQ